MKQYLAQIAIVVEDYDEAIEFYVGRLNFILVEDTALSEIKRWVVVAPPGSSAPKNGTCCLLLAKASNEDQKERIGNQTGGRVFLFLYTDDFWRDYNNLTEKGISIVRKPVKESYGTVAVFKDLYGNLWDLVQPSNQL